MNERWRGWPAASAGWFRALRTFPYWRPNVAIPAQVRSSTPIGAEDTSAKTMTAIHSRVWTQRRPHSGPTHAKNRAKMAERSTHGASRSHHGPGGHAWSIGVFSTRASASPNVPAMTPTLKPAMIRTNPSPTGASLRSFGGLERSVSACFTRAPSVGLVRALCPGWNPSFSGSAAYFLAASGRPCTITACHSRDWCFHVHVWTP